VLEDTANVIQAGLADPRVLIPGEQRLAVLPDALVSVHARAVVAEDGLGHKGHGLPVAQRDVLGDVFVQHHLVGHARERVVTQIDLGLARGRHLRVMLLDDDAGLLHLQDHLGADVLLGIRGRHGKIALFMPRPVAKVGSTRASRFPDPFHRLHEVIARVSVLIEAHAVENEKLGFRPKIGDIAYPRSLEVILGLLGDVARIPRVKLARDGIDDVADHGERRPAREGVLDGRLRVRDHHHVARVDRLPASYAGAVESQPLLEEFGCDLAHRNGEVLPCTRKIPKLEVHDLDVVPLDEVHDVIGLLSAFSFSECVSPSL
jgi:hypothetical protein